MLSNQNSKTNNPDFPLLQKGQIMGMLFGLIEKCLQTFKNEIQKATPEIKDLQHLHEEFYNTEFSRLFQESINDSSHVGWFTFQNESSDLSDFLKKGKKSGMARRVDLAIRLHHSKERILLVEGKRLYNRNDKQYVSGNTGGICRFKREQHGSEMSQACIVGYMETETFSFWHEKVNNWLDDEKSKSKDLEWGDDEYLYTPSEPGNLFAYFTSNHLRITKPSISLYHYWVDVSSIG